MGSPLEEKIEKTKALFKTYISQQMEVVKLEVVEKISVTVSRIISYTLIGFFSVLMLIFLSITAAIAIGYALANMALGFLFVAGFYFLLILILFLFKGVMIHNPITNSIIRKMLDGDDK